MDTYANYIDTTIRHWPTVLIIITSIVGIVIVFLVVRIIINRRFLMRRDMVWLEITPPSSIAKTPEATEQLFSVLHGTRAARHLKERLLNRSPVMSFEIVSTRKDGVRYLLQVEQIRSASIQKVITSYIPDSKVKEVERDTSGEYSVIEFRETGHYVLPRILNRYPLLR